MTPEFNSNFEYSMKNENAVENLCNLISKYKSKYHDPGLFCTNYYNNINSTEYESEEIWESIIKDYLIKLGLITEKKAEKKDEKRDAGAIARNLFLFYDIKKLYNSESMEYTRMVYYVCAALNLTFEQTAEVCSKVFFKRPFHVRCSIDAVFYVFFKLRDSKIEMTDLIKRPKKGKENSLYEYLSNVYYNSTRQFTREQKSNDDNIISDLNKIIGEIQKTNSNDELAKYLEDNYLPAKNSKGRLEKPENYQNAEITKVTKQLCINCLIYNFLTDPKNNIINDIFDKWTDSNSVDKIGSPEKLTELWFPSEIGVITKADRNDPVWSSLPCKAETLEKYLKDLKSRVNSTLLRKMLIISYFFNYHVLKVNPYRKKWQPFRDHMDELLEKCGFQKLYERNPFDAIFLVSAEYESSYNSAYMPKWLSDNKYPNICTLYDIWHELFQIKGDK